VVAVSFARSARNAGKTGEFSQIHNKRF